MSDLTYALILIVSTFIFLLIVGLMEFFSSDFPIWISGLYLLMMSAIIAVRIKSKG